MGERTVTWQPSPVVTATGTRHTNVGGVVSGQGHAGPKRMLTLDELKKLTKSQSTSHSGRVDGRRTGCQSSDIALCVPTCVHLFPLRQAARSTR